MTLREAVNLAVGHSPYAKQAEARHESSYWNYRFEKSTFSLPQVRLNGYLPNYQKATTGITQPDGTISFRSIDQLNAYSNISVQQPIALTGGLLSINSDLSYFSSRAFGGSSWNGNPLQVQINQPIFAFNKMKWDRIAEPLRFEESKRAKAEEMEFISRLAVERYFATLSSQIDLEIAIGNLAHHDTILSIEQDRYRMGTTTKERLLRARIQVLQSRMEMARAKIVLKNSRAELNSFLGLDVSTKFDLELPARTPPLRMDIASALQYARGNRAIYASFTRRRIESDSEVARSRGESFQTNISASFGLNNSGRRFTEVYGRSQEQQTINVSFSIPIIDWGRNRSRMQSALANKRLNAYMIAIDEMKSDQEIIDQISQFDVLADQIEISRESAELTNEIFLLTKEKYLNGKADINALAITVSEKDAARRSYVDALRSYWLSYYTLRRLTLFDFDTGVSLYKGN